MRDRDQLPYYTAALDSPEAESGDAITPRGGFMARPGLKSPPRHAVVVRMGDAPASEHIPVARESVPPPAPSEPAAPASDEKVTLRAIPTRSSSSPPLAVESVPPPSEMPVVASIRAPELARATSRRSRRAGVTIALASAAGIVLGLASVAMTRLSGADAQADAGDRPSHQAVSEQPGVALEPPAVAPLVAGEPLAGPLPSASASPPASASAAATPLPAGRGPGERRSIF